MSAPKQNHAGAALIRECIIAGLLNRQIRIELARAGFPSDVTDQTFTQYRQDPWVIAAVNQAEEEAFSLSIAKRNKRVVEINRRWERALRLIEARANDMAGDDVTGGDTGLLIRIIKSIGAGDNAREIVEYQVDLPLLKEIREMEKQAAIEVGQWTEKSDVSSGGKPLEITTLVLGQAGAELTEWRKQMTEGLSNTPSAPPTPPTSPTTA